MYIHTDNGLFPQFVRDKIWKPCMQLVENVCDIKCCVCKKYAALL
jgi:hypothetical protein